MKNHGYLLTAPYTFELKETILPERTPDRSVMLQIQYCGICGGDHSCYLGRRAEYPKSLGHEFVGKIVAVGAHTNMFSVGDYVISDLNYRCGTCEYCLQGKSHLCTKNNIEQFSNRGFFEYMVIDSSYLHKISFSTSILYRATLIEPLSCIIHAVNQCGHDETETVMINGCGSIGMLLCFYLTQKFGFKNIVVHDSNYDRSGKLSKLLELEQLSCCPAETFDTVWECTNSVEGMKSSLKAVKKGGKLFALSHLYGEQTSFIYETLCKKEIHPMFPLRNGSSDTLCTATSLIQNQWKQSWDSLLGIYDFTELPDIFRRKNSLLTSKQIIQYQKSINGESQ